MASNGFIGTASIQDIILLIFAIILTFFLGALVNALIIRLLKDKVRPSIYKPISKIIMYTIYIAGLFIAFNYIIDFDLSASLAALGFLGFVILWPILPILQNIAAGFIISLERPFQEEDVVNIDGQLAVVKDIMLMKTVFRSYDGKIITVPNILFLTYNPIVNYSRGEFIKIKLSLDLESASDKDDAIKVIKKICADDPYILPNVPQKKLTKLTKIFEIPKNFFTIPRNIKQLTPQVLIKRVNKEKVTLEVWFWIWDILMKEKTVDSFYSKLIIEFKKEKIKFG
ncbi:mechanosensitive ion channel family protein [Nanoarchaeota archaeon]